MVIGGTEIESPIPDSGEHVLQKFQRRSRILALAILIDFVFTSDASAYLDPGTGSFLFQTVIAVVLGATFTLKVYWQRVKLFFSGKPSAVREPSVKSKEDESGDA
jgi:hypothetical protein